MSLFPTSACWLAPDHPTFLLSIELRIDKQSPFDFFALKGLTWIDWSTALGLILTISGFGITWWQLHRTRTARQAVTETRIEINRSTASERLSKSIPSLRALYTKARSAAYEKDKVQLQRRLDDWSVKCTEAITQLEKLQSRRTAKRWGRTGDENVAAVLGKLRSAQGRVGEALRKMDEQPDMVDLESGVKYALAAMREFSALAAAMEEESHYVERVS